MNTAHLTNITNTIINGGCLNILPQLQAESVDFILTDLPYLVNYKDRSGRSIQGIVNLFVGTKGLLRFGKERHCKTMRDSWKGVVMRPVSLYSPCHTDEIDSVKDRGIPLYRDGAFMVESDRR